MVGIGGGLLQSKAVFPIFYHYAEKNEEEKKESHSQAQTRNLKSTLQPTAYSLKAEQHIYHISTTNLNFDDLTVAALAPPIIAYAFLTFI